jgi:hypothetical protein
VVDEAEPRIRELLAVLIPTRCAEDLFAGWWGRLVAVGAVGAGVGLGW